MTDAPATAQPPLKPGLRPGQLKHGVALVDLVMLGAGTAIGAAIFSVLGPAAKVGGSGILIACLLAAIPMVIFGLVYAFMASAAPRTAASYEWQRQFTHPLIAFAIVWMRVLSNAVVMIVLGRTMINYLGMVVPLPETATVLGFFFVIFVHQFPRRGHRGAGADRPDARPHRRVCGVCRVWRAAGQA